MKLLFLTLFFSIPVLGMDKLVHTYPELIPFFSSVEFKNQSYGCEDEFFADEYAIQITKNKDAALSALEKRRLLYQEKRSVYCFLNFVKDLFKDHPIEDVRSECIRNRVL